VSTLKINNVEIFYHAIESLRVDNNILIIRTVSGKEYKREYQTEDEAKKAHDYALQTMDLHFSL